MSEQKARRLIEQLQRSARNSNIDPKLVEALAEAIKGVLEDAGGIDAETANVGEISQNYENIRKMLEETQGSLGDAVGSEKLLAESFEDELEMLKERVVVLVQSDGDHKKELEIIRKRIKELAKVVKANQDHQRGMEKGEAAAESLMQATFGISKGWDDISAEGLVKGYGMGLMKSLSFSNVLASLTSKVFETMLRFDKARAAMFEKAQISREQLNVGRVATEMGAIGVNLEGVAAEAGATLKTNFMSFGELTTGEGSQLESLAAGIGVMSKLGVSMEQSAEFLGTQIKTFGKTPEDADALLQGMVGIATALGRPPEELVSEFNRAQPILARFEDELGRKIFKRTMFEATKLNIEASKLLSISEGMDTFEGAAQMAQSLNLAFSGPIVSAQALLGARDIGERRKIIIDSLKSAGKSINDLSERTLRGLANSPGFSQFGGNVAELKRFLDEGADTFSMEREGLNDLGTSMQDNQKMIEENLSMSTKLDAKFQEAINNLVVAIGGEKGIMTLVDGIVFVIDKLANNLEAFMVLIGGLTLAKIGGPAVTSGALGSVLGRTLGMTAGGLSADPVEQQQEAIRREVQQSTAAGNATASAEADSTATDVASAMANLQRRNTGMSPSSVTSRSDSSTSPDGRQNVQHISVTTHAKNDGFGVTELGGNERSMVSPDISRQYVQPVFHKNDHFYAAKSDGAMAKALDEIIEVVGSLLEKNQNLKLSIKEREFGLAVYQSMSRIRRL